MNRKNACYALIHADVNLFSLVKLGYNVDSISEE